VKRSWLAIGVLVALFAGAGALIAVEFSNGATDVGTDATQDPCDPRTQFPGEGVDGTIQRIVLNGLDGAACQLDVTREELVLSFESRSGVKPIPWDDETIEEAVRAGMLRAVDDAQDRGELNGLVATVVRGIVERAPLQWLIDGGQEIAGLFD
jgi:hypothetical protein